MSFVRHPAGEDTEEGGAGLGGHHHLVEGQHCRGVDLHRLLREDVDHLEARHSVFGDDRNLHHDVRRPLCKCATLIDHLLGVVRSHFHTDRTPLNGLRDLPRSLLHVADAILQHDGRVGRYTVENATP